MEIKKIKQKLAEWNAIHRVSCVRGVALGNEILEQLVKDFGIKEK